MRALLIIACAVAALAGCAQAPVQRQAVAPGGVQISGHATLARFGYWEFQLAPTYTALAALRDRTTAALRGGRITIGTAEAVLVTTDLARAALDQSRRNADRHPTDAQRLKHIEAQRLLDEAKQLLENGYEGR